MSSKALFLILILISYIPVFGQVDTAWVRRYNGLGNFEDIPTSLKVDETGNVYVTGSSYGNGTSTDYATIKYSPDGETLWVRRYDGTANSSDFARALAIDEGGYVYVTGYSIGVGTYDDYLTIKYSPNGDTEWIKRYNGVGDSIDNANAMAVDDTGNVYVTGTSWNGSSYDFTTIKYSSVGDTLWVRHYNGPPNGIDQAIALSLDSKGNVVITGFSDGGGLNFDYVTIQYSPDGKKLWLSRYDGSAYDIANALAVDKNGNIYVTGQSFGIDADYATIKYTSNGDTVWVRRYNGPGNEGDYPSDLCVDGNGNVCVTGVSWVDSTYYDYATVKYSSNGNTLWTRQYNGPSYGFDGASAIATNPDGDVYVTGISFVSGTTDDDYVTIRYFPTGDPLWVKSYNGPGNFIDEGRDIFLDKNGNVYVTGNSAGIGTSYDYATIKYVQSCSVKAGDANGDSRILLSDVITLINYIFKSGPTPNPLCRGDVNKEGSVTLPDIVYLINFLFKYGPAPVKSHECCL